LKETVIGYMDEKLGESNQMSGARIWAIAALSVSAVLFFAFALGYFGHPYRVVPCPPGPPMPDLCEAYYPAAKTYGYVNLVLAGAAAFGAIVVYRSRPR
jgi:hypothetical protein